MRHLFSLLILILLIPACAHAAPPWNRNSADRLHAGANSSEIEKYATAFDAFDMVVGSAMLECKGKVGIYQALLAGVDNLPAAALADGAYKDIADCIHNNQHDIDTRSTDLPKLSAEVSAYVLPAIQGYLATVQQALASLIPEEENGVREGMEEYDSRFAQMQQEIDITADMVRDSLEMVNQ